jgi:endonuclease YncB( thermonuclease family)
MATTDYTDTPNNVGNTDTYESLFANFCRLYDRTLQRKKRKDENLLGDYWQMGVTILAMIGTPGRKEQYGQKNFTHLSHDLTKKYGKGFKTRTVRYFRDFASQYQKEELNTALKWSHYRALLSVTDKKERTRLEQRIVKEHLSKDALQKIISLSRKQRQSNTPFTLTPRNATPGIFKIVDIDSATECAVVDLGFNVNRALSLPGVPPIPGTYVTRISPRKFGVVSIQPGERYCYTGKLLNVIDGDTVRMRIHLHFDTAIDIPLRLRGVDAMEIDTKEGKRAKSGLEHMLKDQTHLTVYTYHHDRYGRYIADLITTDGTYINRQLVEKGLACFLKM